jgi:hypothetical protein
MSVCQAAVHWKQCGKFRAIKEGDANTKFFHARASKRFRRNLVRELEVDGEIIVAHDGKAVALHRFYSDLLGHARLIRLKRIYNFLCSMLVFTQFALCFVTLCGVFMRFPELTY